MTSLKVSVCKQIHRNKKLEQCLAKAMIKGFNTQWLISQGNYFQGKPTMKQRRKSVQQSWLVEDTLRSISMDRSLRCHPDRPQDTELLNINEEHQQQADMHIYWDWQYIHSVSRLCIDQEQTTRMLMHYLNRHGLHNYHLQNGGDVRRDNPDIGRRCPATREADPDYSQKPRPLRLRGKFEINSHEIRHFFKYI